MLGVWNILQNVQSNVIFPHQHVSVTPVTIIRWFLIRIQSICNYVFTNI